MALLRWLVIAVVCVTAPAVYGHHMGRTVPIGYADKASIHLVAQVIASYFEEQMGREMKLIVMESDGQSLKAIRDREFPMAVVSSGGAGNLPEGVIRMDGVFGAPGLTSFLVMGTDAKEKLEFSLVQRYLDKLTEKLSPIDWERALSRIEAGEGIRGVVLDMLREKDLI